MSECQHIAEISQIINGKKVCEECAKSGSTWVHLRVCQECGRTLCCDSSPHRHATAHFHATGHAVIASAEKGERWLWCYIDKEIVSY